MVGVFRLCGWRQISIYHGRPQNFQKVKTRLRLKRRVFPSNLPWQPRCRFSYAKLGRKFCAPPFQVVCPFRFRRNVPIKVSVSIRKALGLFLFRCFSPQNSTAIPENSSASEKRRKIAIGRVLFWWINCLTWLVWCCNIWTYAHIFRRNYGNRQG